MRHAPPVAVRCNGGWAWRALQSGLMALATGVLVFWALSRAGSGAGLAAAGAVLLAGAAAGWAWRFLRQPLHALAWTGQGWTIDDAPVEPAVMVDLGPGLLLRLRPLAEGAGLAPGHAPAPAWLAVTAAEAGSAWPALRVALYARRPLAPAAATPPAE